MLVKESLAVKWSLYDIYDSCIYVCYLKGAQVIDLKRKKKKASFYSKFLLKSECIIIYFLH